LQLPLVSVTDAVVVMKETDFTHSQLHCLNIQDFFCHAHKSIRVCCLGTQNQDSDPFLPEPDPLAGKWKTNVNAGQFVLLQELTCPKIIANVQAKNANSETPHGCTMCIIGSIQGFLRFEPAPPQLCRCRSRHLLGCRTVPSPKSWESTPPYSL